MRRTILIYSALLALGLATASPARTLETTPPLPRPDHEGRNNLTIRFLGMEEYLGYPLDVRVTDKHHRWERERTSLNSIQADSFDISFQNTTNPEDGYWVDLFTDLNGNDFYDAPPTDHAWRLVLNEPDSTDTLIYFTPTDDFVNIPWVYRLRMNLSGMTPYLGKTVKLRVLDGITGTEAGRAFDHEVAEDAFDLLVVGILPGRTYHADLFVDVNDNNRYDGPPQDHSWRVSFFNNQGYETLDFAPHENYDDVNWGNLFVVHLNDMMPEFGLPVRVRLWDPATGRELSQDKVDSVALNDFDVYGWELQSGSYYADFYTDRNGNHQYDPPPVDHAWRIAFTAGRGDQDLGGWNYTTEFTDIQWPSALLEPEPRIDGVDPGAGAQSGEGAAFRLLGNQPNPFNPETAISYRLPASGHVSLRVYDIAGREVATLVNGWRDAGAHEATFDGSGLASGVYLVRLEAGRQQATGRMVLLK
ncbi:MAG: T9SS C-terminal target domain-containing protein [Candidatus Zixiibacteriota bacterium]|nr:MAG: T9SS C-terminal target domain-containing protein [candidate division Zixibacteria bacterium]